MFRQSKSTIPFSRFLEDPLWRKLIMCSAVKPSSSIWLFRKSLTVGCFRESWRNRSWQLCHNDCLSMPSLARKVSASIRFQHMNKDKRESILQTSNCITGCVNWRTDEKIFPWLFIAFFPYKQEDKCYKCLIQHRKLMKSNFLVWTAL